MARKKIEITTRHHVNFGTADKPDHKTRGDVVECEAGQADELVIRGYAKYTEQPRAAKSKEDTTNGN